MCIGCLCYARVWWLAVVKAITRIIWLLAVLCYVSAANQILAFTCVHILALFGASAVGFYCAYAQATGSAC
jgi:hypothetical protein